MPGTSTERQYLLVVRNIKGFPVFQLNNVATNYDSINDPNVSGSVGAGATLNLSLDEPNGTGFTLTTTVP